MKRMAKVEEKNIEGEVVKSERRVVRISVTARRGQRRSAHLVAVSERKRKARGKEASKLMLSMSLRVLEGYVEWLPIKETTPQPPSPFVMKPA